MMKLSWSATAGIQARAVESGLERRGPLGAIHLSVDETSFRKRHRYVTIATDQEKPRVLHVATGRNTDSLEEYFETLSEEECEAIESVAMDMQWPFIKTPRSTSRTPRIRLPSTSST